MNFTPFKPEPEDTSARGPQRVCRTNICKCLKAATETSTTDGTEEFTCECFNDGHGQCVSCHATLVSVDAFERDRARRAKTTKRPRRKT